MGASTMRLDRLLANLGYGSRREIERLAALGRIVLDGRPIADASTRLPVTPNLATRLVIDS